jgi:cold shock CspA family protein
MQTTVKWFNIGKGYGFLENGTGPDIYVNAKSLRGADKVMTGDVVEFECHVFEGKLVARHVQPVRRENTAHKSSAQSSTAPASHLNGNDNNGNTISNGNSSNSGNSNRQPYPNNRIQQPRFVMQ